MKSTKAKNDMGHPAPKLGPAAGDSVEKQSRTVGRKLRWPKKTLFALAVVCLFFGGVELLLGFWFWLSNNSEQSMLTSAEYARWSSYSDYPANPEEYTKIAVFGGSAAAGQSSSRAFHEIIDYELQKQFPHKNFYIKNFAQGGYPFHRHQAEHVKLLIDKFDFFLIYCGNNEAENWFDDSGYWRYPEYKDAKELVYQRPVEAQPPLLQGLRLALEEHSNIYSLFRTAKGKIKEIELPLSRNRRFDFNEFEEADAIPPEEKKKIVRNFEKDVVAICKLAQKYDKQVLISVSATHETWPPCFSYFRQNITTAEKERWQEIYRNGVAEYNKHNYDTAISSFRRARKIDSSVAILNHRLGMSYLKQGDSVQGRRYLRQAIDQDGYYSRSITPLHRKAKELSGKYDRLHYVATVAAFHRILDGDINDADLFNDHCHLSFLGHVIIGNIFVNKLHELEPFRSWSSASGRGVAETNWKVLAYSYFQELGITDAEQADAAETEIYFLFDMAHWTAYPEYCYESLAKMIVHFEEKAVASRWARVFAKVSRGRLAVARKDYSLAVRMLNEALQISPAELNAELDAEAWTHFVGSEFQSVGIEFSRQQGEFVMTR